MPVLMAKLLPCSWNAERPRGPPSDTCIGTFETPEARKTRGVSVENRHLLFKVRAGSVSGRRKRTTQTCSIAVDLQHSACAAANGDRRRDPCGPYISRTSHQLSVCALTAYRGWLSSWSRC